MIDIFGDELIQRYFGTVHDGCPEGCRFDHDGMTAYRVLKSMQEPVQEGQLYLAVSEYGKVTGPITFILGDHHTFHGHWLVLPTKFQKSCDHDGYLTCVKCGTSWTDGHEVISTKPQPEPDKPKPEKCDGKPCIYRLVHTAGMNCRCLCHTPVDAVEAKIKEISGWFQRGEENQFKKLLCVGLEQTLRELVKLARS